jgi:hypothetical protein
VIHRNPGATNSIPRIEQADWQGESPDTDACGTFYQLPQFQNWIVKDKPQIEIDGDLHRTIP